MSRLFIKSAMALSLAACKTHGQMVREETEADVTCYWSADEFAGRPDVREALSDGRLTVAECNNVVMPYVRESVQAALERARQKAVSDASGTQARMGNQK